MFDRSSRSLPGTLAALAGGGWLVLAGACGDDGGTIPPPADAGGDVVLAQGTDAAGATNDAGSDADAGGELVTPADGGTALCNPPTPIDATRYRYKAARRAPGSCTTADVDDLTAYVRDHPAADRELNLYAKGKYTAECYSCMFAPATDATWTPFLLRGDEVQSLNQSGCVEIVSGKGVSCGEAHRQWDQCIDEGCAGCAGGPARLACRRDVQSGACADAKAAVSAACGSGINEYQEACRSFREWITRQCVAP
jgi:hypothetical protein